MHDWLGAVIDFIEALPSIARQKFWLGRYRIGSAHYDATPGMKVSRLLLGIEDRTKQNNADKRASNELDQVVIILFDNNRDTNKKFILNVDKSGRVKSVALLPHTGRSPKEFNLIDVGMEHYRSIIIDFLDQAIPT